MSNEEAKAEYLAFLQVYRDAIEEDRRGADATDEALYALLVSFAGEVYPMIKEPGYFHKAFRQVDVVHRPKPFGISDDELENLRLRGCVDGAIWCLLQESPIFWRVFSKRYFADTEPTEEE